MIHISLFSGIGGFELAAEWMGWRNLVSCDINEFGNKIRKHYWPDGYCHTDIKTLTYEKINSELSARFGSGWRDDDIILTGGFPCQPYSAAGKRLGKDDERHLWPEMLRVIQEVKPTFIVGENVRGLTNWNGGVVFEEVCADLENCGYEVQPILLPACAVNAPHRRDRVWFVAYSKSNYNRRECRWMGKKNGEKKTRRQEFNWTKSSHFSNEKPTPDPNGNGQHQCDRQHEIDPGQGGQHALNDIDENDGQRNASDSKCKRLFRQNKTREENINYWESSKLRRDITRYNQQNKWSNFPTQPPICGGDDGLPTKLDGITFPKWRAESIKAYGNAIVPQVAYQIFKALIIK